MESPAKTEEELQNTTEDTQPQTNETPESTSEKAPPEEHPGNLATIIGIILTVLVIALGTLYFFGNKEAELPPATGLPSLPTESFPPVPTSDQASLSTSTEITAIEADLETTELDSLDAELEELETELDTLIEEL